MMYLIAAITALMLVTGQSLWKQAAVAVSNQHITLNAVLFKVLLTPKFIGGSLLYVAATLLYLWLFSKFSYSNVQLTLIAFSIIFSTLVASLFFKETITIWNSVGVFLLIIGVFLVTLKG